MSLAKTAEPRAPRPKPEVKGPIRCHKCQMLCRDAEEYRTHHCERGATRL